MADPDTPLHTVVGKEAARALDLMGRASYEEWLPQFVQQAGALVGPRPAAPPRQ